MNPYGPATFCLGKLFITVLISVLLMDAGLLRLTIFSCVNFGELYV